jgi:hypothetical protein
MPIDKLLETGTLQPTPAGLLRLEGWSDNSIEIFLSAINTVAAIVNGQIKDATPCYTTTAQGGVSV